MNARDEILARIGEALAAPQPTIRGVERDYRVAGQCDLTADQMVDLLVDRLVDYGAGVHRSDGDGIAKLVASVLTKNGVEAVLAPEGLSEGIVRQLRSMDRLAVVIDGPALTSKELDALDAVITTSVIAIAQTGTIILDGGPGQGRRAASLVPDLHLLIVRADQVVFGVPEAMELLDPTKPMTWISGPSATSDIELKRVEGVHGPRRLEVFILS